MPHDKGRIYGSFKKICIPESELRSEAEILKADLLRIQSGYYEKTISECDVAFHIILLYLERRVKKHPFLRMGKKLPNREYVNDFLEVVRFYGMPDTVRYALWKWHLNEWDIRLIDYNPTSIEMLQTQSQGIRFATICWEEAISGKLVEGKRDAFEHLLHDLAHAYMFFREDYDFLGQKKFFKSMLVDFQHYQMYLENDPIFKEKFEYCISDMNSHPAHLQAYWNAIRKEAGIPILELNV